MCASLFCFCLYRIVSILCFCVVILFCLRFPSCVFYRAGFVNKYCFSWFCLGSYFFLCWFVLFFHMKLQIDISRKIALEYWCGCVESVDYFWYLLQIFFFRFEVLVIQIFHLLGMSWTNMFSIVCGYCKVCRFLKFFSAHILFP